MNICTYVNDLVLSAIDIVNWLTLAFPPTTEVSSELRASTLLQGVELGGDFNSH